MSPTVDIHHHVFPDFYWQASNEDGNAAGGITPPPWSLDGAIAYLDEAEIDVAVASISTPGVHFGDDRAARALGRRVNEYLADVKRERPDRFGAFAAIPLPDVEGSLEQIEYALDTLRLDGVSLMTNADRSYLGDSRFDPVFEELQRREAVVFIHPTASPDPVAHTLGLPDSLLDYPVDTSRAIAKLHYSNTFARTRDVKYVIPHAGGTIPFVASRFAIVDQMNVIPGADGRGPFMESLRRCTGTRPQPSATQCCTCCDRSPGSTTLSSAPTTPIRTMRFRSAVLNTFEIAPNSTMTRGLAFSVTPPLACSRASRLASSADHSDQAMAGHLIVRHARREPADKKPATQGSKHDHDHVRFHHNRDRGPRRDPRADRTPRAAA